MKSNIREDHVLCTFLMLLLAFFPILTAYINSFNFNFGETAFILLLLLALIRVKSIKIFKFPDYYFYFWIYVAIALLITSNEFKITYLIPGGIAFFIFSLSLGLSSMFFNIEVLYKGLKILFFVALVFFLMQNLNLLPPQYQVVAVFPISDHVAYTNTDFEALMDLRSTTIRPSSLFLEPAYYAQFILVLLTIELFYKAQKRLFTPLAVLAIVVLLFLRSGLGISCLAIVILFKLLSFYNILQPATLKNKKTGLFVVLFLIIIASWVFLSTEIGQELLERKNEFTEEGSSGFLRFVQGFMIFDALPIRNKIFGISMEDVASMHLSFFTYTPEGDVKLFTNGLCTLLIRTGLLGFIFLFVVYFKIFKKGTPLARALILLLFFMSLLEQVYLASSMLLCTVIAASCTKRDLITTKY